jgi:hypothetical protein
MCRGATQVPTASGKEDAFEWGRQDEGVGIIFVVSEMGRPWYMMFGKGDKVEEVEA